VVINLVVIDMRFLLEIGWQGVWPLICSVGWSLCGSEGIECFALDFWCC
jgi:hypothetical protein